VTQLERDLWKLVKPHLPGEVERVENLVSSGTPDVSGAFVDRDYWVELKVCRTKKLQDMDKLCSALQLRWHHRRAVQGSRVFVLVRHGDTLLLYFVKVNGKETWYELSWYDSKPWNWGIFFGALTVRLR
jgi:hypothetical protein